MSTFPSKKLIEPVSEISEDVEDLKNFINQIDIIDVYRTFYPTTIKCTLTSRAHHHASRLTIFWAIEESLINLKG